MSKDKPILSLKKVSKFYYNKGLVASGFSKISLDFSKHMGFSIKETNELLLCICYHDIGKLIVPSSILFSTCKLSDQEWSLIKNHVNFINTKRHIIE